MFLKMIFAIGAMTVAVVLFLKYIAPRWLMPKQFKDQQFFKVLARYYLAPRKFLCLVKAGEQKYIIAVTDNNMQLLSEVKDEAVEKQK